MARRRCGQKAKAKRSWGQGTFSFIDNVLEKDLASFSVNKAVLNSQGTLKMLIPTRFFF